MNLNIEYYTRSNRTSPIQEFINELPDKAQVKTIETFGLLRDYGLEVGMPHIRPLSGMQGTWEVRIKSNKNIYRYPFIIEGGTAVILHAFAKKTQKTPEKELKMIKRRTKEIL